MLTKEFFEAVHSEDRVLVRIMMKDSLLVDPSFHDFYEMEKEAALMKDLYQPHDGGTLEESSEKWTVDYMNEQMADVILNFSRERMDHLQKVVRFLYPVKSVAKPSTPAISKSAGRSSSTKGTPHSYQRKTNQQRRSDSSVEKIMVGVVVGAVVGGVVASLASVTVVGGTVAGALVGGTAMAVKEKGGH